MPKLDSIMSNLNTLTSDSALLQTLHNTAELTAQLKETSVRLNAMMQGDVPRLTQRLHAVGANMEKLTGNLAAVDVNATMQKVDATLDGVQQFSVRLNTVADQFDQKLNSTDNTLGLFLNDRSVYDNLSGTLRHADSLMIDLKAHPKRYVHFSVFGKKDK